MRYFLWSSQAAEKFGYAVYDVDGQVINCTAIDYEDWREKYKWSDTEVVAISDHFNWVQTIKGPKSVKPKSNSFDIQDFFESRIQ